MSIHPETHVLNHEGYQDNTTTSAITDFHYKAQTLHLTFADGNVYSISVCP